MTHDEHFLSRLERASDEEVRFAMSLYYDSIFTRHIISLFDLPDQADRVALALSEGERSSHVILSRDGSFITCLGPGMKLVDLPVISRTRFTGLTKWHDKIVERHAEIALLIGDGSIKSILNNSLYKAGRNLTREEFKKWEIFKPLVLSHLVRTQSLTAQASFALATKLQVTVRKGRVRNKKERKYLRQLWELRWTQGHIAMILFADSAFVKKIPLETLDNINTGPICLQDTIIPMSLMGLWSISKTGQELFPKIKSTFVKQEHPWECLEATFMLVAIALRHSRYKSEVIKLLKRKMTGLSGTDVQYCEGANKTFSTCLTHQDEHREALEKVLSEKFGKNSKYSEEIKEAPDNIKIAFLAHKEKCFIKDIPSAESMLMFLPWVVQIKAEEFYIPKKYSELFYPYNIGHAMSLVEGGYFDDSLSGF